MVAEFRDLTADNIGGYRGIVYGDQSVGKTSFAVGAYHHPQLRKVGVLDVDKGLHTVAGWDSENIKFADINSSDDMDRIADLALRNQPPIDGFGSWVLDTLNVWFERELMAISVRESKLGKRPTDTLQLQDYKESISRLVRITDKFIVGGKPMIMTSHYDDVGPTPDKPNRQFERRPKLSDKAFKELSARSRFIWYLYQQPNGDINMMTQPVVLPSGMIIQAKTSNAEFAHKLMEMGHRDASGKPTGIITIGNRFDESVPRLTFADFYTIYQNSLKGAK